MSALKKVKKWLEEHYYIGYFSMVPGLGFLMMVHALCT